MSETLEVTARTIFKSWFVDFDPVHAKLEGRQATGISPQAAGLFPADFVDLPNGQLPKGWTVAPLRDHVEVVRGLSYRGAYLVEEGGLPLHNLNSVLEGGGYKHEGLKRYAGEYKERHLVGASDVIVANTEQGHQYLLIGCPALVPATDGELGLFTADLFRVRPLPESPLTQRYLYLLLTTRRLRQQVTAYTSGTTVNHLSVEGLRRPGFVVPPAELIRAFDDLVRPMVDLGEHLVSESRMLTTLRDAVLPRLIAGDL